MARTYKCRHCEDGIPVEAQDGFYHRKAHRIALGYVQCVTGVVFPDPEPFWTDIEKQGIENEYRERNGYPTPFNPRAEA